MTPAPRQRRPLPARVYWVRRTLVLGLALGLVFGIAHLLGGSSSDPSREAAQVVGSDSKADPSASAPAMTTGASPSAAPSKGKPAKPTKAPLAEPSGPCEASDIVVTPMVRGTAYAGGDVAFRLKLTTVEAAACTWRVSAGSVVVKLVSGSDRIWSSQDCPGAVPKADVIVRKEYPAKVDLSWRGQRSDSTCSRTTAWAQPGWYHVQAAAFGAEPTSEQFELRAPVPETITPTPKPEPKKKSKNSDDEED